MPLSYTEYELLCQVIDKFVLGRERLLKMNKLDICAATSFMSPNLKDNEVEESINDMLSTSPKIISRLVTLKAKLLLLVSN
jgi:hypothetical protein